MLNITVGEAGAELSLRAKPIAPWTAELTSTYQLIREKVKFLGGVYTKEVLRPLGRMARAETTGPSKMNTRITISEPACKTVVTPDCHHHLDSFDTGMIHDYLSVWRFNGIKRLNDS